MRIGDYVRPDAVVIGLPARDARGAIEELLGRLVPPGPERAELAEALVRREEAHTTALPHGVAVPHTTLGGLGRPVVAVATSPTGVAFGSVTVRLVLLLLSPPAEGALHVKVLARIARLTRRSGFVDALVSADSPGALLAALERSEYEH